MVIATKLDEEEDILENAVSHNKVLVKDLMITCTLGEVHVKEKSVCQPRNDCSSTLAHVMVHVWCLK